MKNANKNLFQVENYESSAFDINQNIKNQKSNQLSQRFTAT